MVTALDPSITFQAVERKKGKKEGAFIFFLRKENSDSREFPGGPEVMTWCFHCQCPGSNPGQVPKIPKALRYIPPTPQKGVQL